MFAVAIDGPAGAGKSSVARRAAAELGFLYVDTGALYRAVALYMTNVGTCVTDAAAVEARLGGIRLDISYGADGQRVFLNGKDVSEAIRSPEISQAASDVAKHPAVRRFLLDLQLSLARDNNVVMDGRDIGTVVLPQAQVKVFLTASPEERARRRCKELLAKGLDARYEDILAGVKERDLQDSTREVAPLRQAADAVLLDTTQNTLEEATARLVALVRGKLEQP